MAEILQVQQMMAPAFEPKRQNRWVLEWDGLDAYTLKTFARPSRNNNEIVVDYLNTKRYYTGKHEWQPIEMTLYDPIVPSAAQRVEEWSRLCYEGITGRAGYKEFYTARNFKLKLLDPPGGVIEQWDFINAFPTAINYGPLDYASAEITMITMTVRFDEAILQF